MNPKTRPPFICCPIWHWPAEPFAVNANSPLNVRSTAGLPVPPPEPPPVAVAVAPTVGSAADPDGVVGAAEVAEVEPGAAGAEQAANDVATAISASNET